MDIAEAKEGIKTTVRMYLKKDDTGAYCIPVKRQRPVFLLGAPGIGKTAIMEQIAQEMGIALVSYAMTHHTRQSALGLPYIEKKQYGDEEYSISEYTMSEIISTVYETMEKSGLSEGILFLDEINCVSETLAPSMLQFLQYKTFGRHRVPDGWVIVTAGNPPEYNRMVREFDVVTMDRLKLMNVEPDLKAWKKYAAGKQIHGAITAYLEIKPEDFYHMEMSAKGRSYVTARGWEDLSDMLKMYEEESISADETLVAQYLANERVVKEFTAYYELYNKYKRDYRISEILEGRAPEAAVERAKAARFDERISLLGMLADSVESRMAAVTGRMDILKKLNPMLTAYKEKLPGMNEDEAAGFILKMKENMEKQRRKLDAGGALSDAENRVFRGSIRLLEDAGLKMMHAETSGREMPLAAYREALAALQEDSRDTSAKLEALFSFAEAAFEDGNELLTLLTRLTVSPVSSRYIAAFGSETYNRLSDSMMVSKRHSRLREQVEELLPDDI